MRRFDLFKPGVRITKQSAAVRPDPHRSGAVLHQGPGFHAGRVGLIFSEIPEVSVRVTLVKMRAVGEPDAVGAGRGDVQHAAEFGAELKSSVAKNSRAGSFGNPDVAGAVLHQS